MPTRSVGITLPGAERKRLAAHFDTRAAGLRRRRTNVNGGTDLSIGRGRHVFQQRSGSDVEARATLHRRRKSK